MSPPDRPPSRKTYSHEFVETYDGPVAVGLSREIDEATLTLYLQKLSDDRLMETLRGRLPDEEIHEMIERIIQLLRRHLSHQEYHELFLRSEGSPSGTGSR